MKTPSLQVLSRALLILGCVGLSSCTQKDSPNTAAPKSPPPFGRTEFSEVTPMLDGSAYAKSSDSRLWYLRGNKALRVTAPAGASQKLPDFSEITPVLDGSAYATSWEKESGLWYLRAEQAEKVTEVTSLADSGAPKKISDRAFYALYLTELKKRKDAEYRADNPQDFAPDPPEEDPY
jgi:hypothetical protein